jgi:hypothetical protein
MREELIAVVDLRKPRSHAVPTDEYRDLVSWF